MRMSIFFHKVQEENYTGTLIHLLWMNINLLLHNEHTQFIVSQIFFKNLMGFQAVGDIFVFLWHKDITESSIFSKMIRLFVMIYLFLTYLARKKHSALVQVLRTHFLYVIIVRTNIWLHIKFMMWLYFIRLG